MISILEKQVTVVDVDVKTKAKAEVACRKVVEKVKVQVISRKDVGFSNHDITPKLFGVI